MVRVGSSDSNSSQTTNIFVASGNIDQNISDVHVTAHRIVAIQDLGSSSQSPQPFPSRSTARSQISAFPPQVSLSLLGEGAVNNGTINGNTVSLVNFRFANNGEQGGSDAGSPETPLSFLSDQTSSSSQPSNLVPALSMSLLGAGAVNKGTMNGNTVSLISFGFASNRQQPSADVSSRKCTKIGPERSGEEAQATSGSSESNPRKVF